ncbi:MAG: hypothetical protein K0U34_02635 [Alphaproteobacteria bacterium]|nr:hypothetical protein [Alphaproteobacteria bacterium]
MAWTLRMTLLTLILVGSIGCGIATAGEVYICDRNKVVTVAPGQLEHMKRTNACIAAHYGLRLPENTAVKVAASTESQLVSGPVRVQRPEKKIGVAATKSSAKAAAAAVPKVTQKVAKPQVPVPHDTALPVEEVAADPSDYRNIRVLNAKTKPAQWYRHVY